MDKIAEIEAAIKNLPAHQVDQLAEWLDSLRVRHATPAPVDNWLKQAVGAARAGMTTEIVMALTRGEE